MPASLCLHPGVLGGRIWAPPALLLASARREARMCLSSIRSVKFKWRSGDDPVAAPFSIGNVWQNFGSRAVGAAPGQTALHYCEWIAFAHRNLWGAALDAFGELIPSLIRQGINSSECRNRRRHPRPNQCPPPWPSRWPDRYRSARPQDLKTHKKCYTANLLGKK